MKRAGTLAVLLSALAMVVGGCGLNPFGAGQGGLSIFAKIGKAMQKPSAINEEDNSEKNAEATIEAGAMAKRMAKSSGRAADLWLVSSSIEYMSGDQYKYIEVVNEKPGEADPENLFSGTAYVVFRYAGTNPTVATIDLDLITDIDSFYCYGLENKTWKNELDSIKIRAAFSSTTVTDVKPGKIWAWGKNVSATLELGKDDTAYFELDELDDVNKVQYGGGSYYDAHTGKDDTGEPYSFNFSLAVFYKNTLDPSKPYERWQDNEGQVTFTIPWGETGDNLYFVVNFLPNYERNGTIQKNDANGPVLVRFTHNEKMNTGETRYFDEDGKQIGTD